MSKKKKGEDPLLIASDNPVLLKMEAMIEDIRRAVGSHFRNGTSGSVSAYLLMKDDPEKIVAPENVESTVKSEEIRRGRPRPTSLRTGSSR